MISYRMGTLEKPPQELQSKEQRFWQRLNCKYITECRDLRGNQWACKIVDISGNGLGIVSSAVLREGEKISIANPRTEAVVVWATKGRAGLSVCA
jgi:hypothetical protein